MRIECTFDQLERAAELSGLSILGVTDLGGYEDGLTRLGVWQEQGFAGDLGYMQRPAREWPSPNKLLPSFSCAVAFAITYSAFPPLPLRRGAGRVARYALGRDYHRVLPHRLRSFVRNLRDELRADFPSRYFTDAMPFLERFAASRAGLGFVGKNSLLIRRGVGSYLILGEVLLGNPIQVVTAPRTEDRSGCGSCEQCITRCPTGAIVQPYTVDARRCISALTIETSRVLSNPERKMIGEWVFGCDICQEVCPFNFAVAKRGREPDLPQLAPRLQLRLGQIDLRQILECRSDEQFHHQHCGTPFKRVGRAGMVRNAAVVAANTVSEELLETLIDAAQHDSSEIARAHALWAAHTISSRISARRPAWLESLRGDPSHIVQEEIAALDNGLSHSSRVE